MKTARTTFLGLTLAVSICITGGLVYAATVLKHETPQHETPPAFAPDQVIVAFKPGTPAEAKRAAHAQAGGRVIRALKGIGADLVGIPSNKVMDKIAVYKRNPNVRYAEPNHYRTLTVPPSEGLDPYVCNGNYFDEQWYLHNTGQSFLNDIYTGPCALTGAEDADIDWLEAYEAGKTGRSSIKIAMVDSGVEWTHPDLVSKIVETWAAPSVILANEGPEDIIGHGTHVAGIAVAETNNGLGIAGVGGDTSIGSLKVCKCTDSWCLSHICEDADIIDAIFYAINNGYHIINMSLGGPEVAQALQDAVSAAFDAGLILVAGAGNNYQLNPPNHFYPADCEGVISVAATDQYDNIAPFSNFGIGVNVAAPGVNILSTYPAAGCGNIADCYDWKSGTSMATPVVAGAAALVLDSIGDDPIVLSPSLRDDVINAILNNADHSGILGQNMLAWTQHGRLNLQAALTGGGENIPPVAAFTYSCNGLTCDFDASDSNDPDGSIVSYAWNFGDSNTGSGMMPIHTYSDGTYDVILTVTDDDVATDTNSQSVTVSETLDNLHVGDLEGSSTSQGNTWTASVTVMVHDRDHNTVEGAMVSGTWSGGASGPASGTTESGLCTFSYPNIHKKNPSVTLTVDNITKNSVPYDPNENHDADGDSDGNSITVLKP
jgi:thermitase